MHFLERFRIRRIKEAMTYAAKNNEIYHLWWHPHNLGKNVYPNFKALGEILQHYEFLNHQYQFESKNMQELVAKLENERSWTI